MNTFGPRSCRGCGAYGIGCGGFDKANTNRCIEEIKRIQGMLKAAIAAAEGKTP